MFFEQFLHTVQVTPDRVALRYFSESLTYSELAKRIAHRAQDFRDSPTPYWIISTENPILGLVDWLALMYAGKIGILAPKEWRDDYFDFFSDHHDVKNCVAWQPSGVSTRPFPPATVQPHDLFLGILSSGSSGKPKLIWKDYQAWFSAFPHQSKVFDLQSSDALLLIDALAYSANANAALHMLWLGGTVVFTSVKALPQAQDSTVTAVFLVPSHARIWCSYQKSAWPAIRSFFTAGEKLDQTLAKKIKEILPQATLTEYYGAAELGHIAYHQNEDIEGHPQLVGKPFPGVQIQLQGGQIYVQSPYISPEYRAIRTVGDRGMWAGDALVLLGREGRLFNRRGLNIWAEEIEHTAWLMPGLRDVLAIESKSGKIHVLYVAEQTWTPQQWRQLFLAKLPKSKCPSFFKQVPEIPRGAGGKVTVEVAARMYVDTEEDSAVTLE